MNQNDDQDTGALGLDEARRLAQKALDDTHWSVALVVGEHRETAEGWIFASRAKSGEPVFGNPALAVDKRSGKVTMPPDGWRAFEDPLHQEAPRPSIATRIRRWWKGGE
ncbi:MAG: hypothetical protein JXR96_04625 [Deltaproteobacteria bacterium]|nr:hypothetical protein [Deltaproteobacteria bacterium]